MVLAAVANNLILEAATTRHPGAFSCGLREVHLTRGQIVEVAGERIITVYFPVSAVLSLTTSLDGEKAMDVALIGAEGLSGLSLILGNDLSLYTKMVRVSGTALQLPAETFVNELERSPGLRTYLMKYVEALRYQVAAAAAAASYARLEVRLARITLMLHDRTAGDLVRVTHDTLAAILGATRPAVTSACIALEESGLLRCSRGRIEVVDRQGLAQLASSSYGGPEAQYRRLLC